jgi:hypothetical protein
VIVEAVQAIIVPVAGSAGFRTGRSRAASP